MTEQQLIEIGFKLEESYTHPLEHHPYVRTAPYCPSSTRGSFNERCGKAQNPAGAVAGSASPAATGQAGV